MKQIKLRLFLNKVYKKTIFCYRLKLELSKLLWFLTNLKNKISLAIIHTKLNFQLNYIYIAYLFVFKLYKQK